MGTHSFRPLMRTSRWGAGALASTILMVVGIAVIYAGGGVAGAAVVPTVGLGTSAGYGVLGGSTVTNVGPSVVNGLNVGVSPGSAVTGFPPGLVTAPGTLHRADAPAAQAKAAALTAFNDARGRPAAPADKGLTDLVGKTLQPGVYQGNLGLSGTLTLDNRVDPDAVFIFQASSTLITASSSVVKFTTSHASCNVFWELGSSATLGTNSKFVGTILAHTSISAQTGATVIGRLLADTGAVTLHTNVITAPSCAQPTTTSDSPTKPTSTTAPSRSTAASRSTAPTRPTAPRTTISAPNENTTPSTIPLQRTTPGTRAATTISPPNENTTPSTITLLTTTPSTAQTTDTLVTVPLTQPSFPNGAPGGHGPPDPISPIGTVGAMLVLLGGLGLLWRLVAVRRPGAWPHRSRTGSGEHR